MAYSSDNEDNLTSLYEKARTFCSTAFIGSDKVRFLYRCKSEKYFDDIIADDGVMNPVLKDNGGDPDCPINEALSGVFFGVTLFNSGLPKRSPFGECMVLVPLKELFTETSNLYFADFYCMRGCSDNHYVCLVLTEKGSAEDSFCKQNLIALDSTNNIFLKRQKTKRGSGTGYEVSYSTIKWSKLYLEVFYTNDVDINDKTIEDVDIIGQGHSSPGGIPKNPDCPLCNV